MFLRETQVVRGGACVFETGESVYMMPLWISRACGSIDVDTWGANVLQPPAQLPSAKRCGQISRHSRWKPVMVQHGVNASRRMARHRR